ncbi:MAG: autotransporter outer membrane beta-barrel domain-containing protein [Pseudomonadota bacterium]
MTAFAQCAPDPANDGDEVVCTGVDNDGIQIFESNISLIIADDAFVTADGNTTLRLSGADNTFVNRGEITGNPDFSFSGVVSISGLFGSNTVNGVNEGRISVFGSGSALELSSGVLEFENREGAFITSEGSLDTIDLDSGFNGTLSNSGVIRSETGRAIDAFTSSTTGTLRQITIINEETGVIESGGGVAINNFGGDFLDITNKGVIRSNASGAFDAAVNIDEGSILRNETGGLIEGENGTAVRSSAFGSRGQAYIFNDGELRGAGFAVTGGAYSLVNNGFVNGDIGGGAQVVNTGRVDGSFDMVSGSLENSGDISGNVAFASGADVFFDFGGTIGGPVTLGAGDDFVLVRTGVDRGEISSIDAGEGFDSFGYSVDAVETLALRETEGFEGFAIEVRFEDSEATLTADDAFSQTVSLFGEGLVINEATISTVGADAVRLYSNTQEFFSGAPDFIDSPFGSGVTFVNDGVVESSGGFALNTLPEPGFFSQASGAERVENNGLINGDVFLGGGDDVFVNRGTVNGSVNLGVGDDVYVVDLANLSDASATSVMGGDGRDAIGFYTNSEASTTLEVNADFETAAAFADGANARLTVLDSGSALPGLRAFGDGTVINTATISQAGITSLFFLDGVGAVELVTDGVTLENEADITGFVGVRLSGDGQTFLNNFDLSRESLSGDSTGNLGFITDAGRGNTIVNNADITVDAFSTAAVFIGDSTFDRFGEFDSEDGASETTTVVNNGRLTANSAALRLSTNLPVIIENNGFISGVEIERSEGGVTLVNADGAEINTISVNGTSFPSEAEGRISIINNGVIGDEGTPDTIFFRADGFGPSGTGPDVADTIVNSGFINANIDFQGGEDAFTVVGDGSVAGVVDGGTEIDTVFFEDFSGAIDVGSFINFERLDISTSEFVSIGDDAAISDSFTSLVIRQGLTSVDTMLPLDVEILENGVLAGVGTILGDVSSVGFIEPGASIGILTIAGDLNLDDGSQLVFEFDETSSDQILVGGDVTLGGELALVSLAAPLTRVSAFTFLSVAGDVAGAFSSVDFATGIGDVQVSPSGEVLVIVTPQILTPTDFSNNALASSDYLNSLVLSGFESASLDTLLLSIFSLDVGSPDVEDALLDLQPEAYAAASTIGVEQAFLATDIVRARAGHMDKRSNGTHFWLSGAGTFARYEGDRAITGTTSFKTTANALIGGVEVVRDNAMIGVYGGRIEGRQTFRSTRVRTDADGFVAGGYGGWRTGALYTDASFGYIGSEAETNRTIAVLGENLVADYDLATFTAQSRVRHDWRLGAMTLSPFSALNYVRTDRDLVSENGGAAALDISGQAEDFLFWDVGAEARRHLDFNGRRSLDASLFAGWRYETLGNNLQADASLRDVEVFTLTGMAADFDRSRLLIGGDLKATFVERTEVFARYRGEFGTDYSQNSVSGGLSVRF